MFVIVTYDISDTNRVNQARKLLKKYLIWTQNSVFEGSISESKFKKCISELDNIIDENEDSLYIYKVKIEKNIAKEVHGVHKNFNDIFL